MTHRIVHYKLLFLLISFLIVAALLIHGIHLFQVNRLARDLLSQAGEAEQNSDTTQALQLLKRYLVFNPGNTEVLARYAVLLQATAQTPADRARLVDTLELVVQRAPGREDLRRRLVRLLLETGAPDLARKHIESLLKLHPDDPVLVEQRGQCLEAAKNPEAAADAYRKALEIDPDQPEVTVRLVRLLRGPLKEFDEADWVMETLVAKHPDQASAWLLRSCYQADKGELDQAEKDLGRARQLAPTDVDVLLASADLAQALGRWQQARAFYQQGVKKHPRTVAFYLGLANLEQQQNRHEEALQTISRGLTELPDNPDLLHAQIEAQLALGALPACQEALVRLRKYPERSALADYLDGKIHMRQQDWASAIVLLQQARSLAGPSVGSAIQLALAECYARRGQPDQELAACREAVVLNPKSVAAAIELARVLLQQHHVDAALETLEPLNRQRGLPLAYWTTYIRVLLAHNQANAGEQRDWAEVERALLRAETLVVGSIEPTLLRAEVLLARNKAAEAADLVARACQARPDQVGLWVARIQIALQRGQADQARAFLQEARQRLGDRPELLAIQLVDAARLMTAGKLPTAAEVQSRLGQIPERERLGLVCSLAEQFLAQGNRGEAERLCRLGLQQTGNLPDQARLLDLLVSLGNQPLLTQAIAQLRSTEGEEGTWWRYGEAMRLLNQAGTDSSGLQEVQSLIKEIRHRRPNWSRTFLLAALLAERQGDTRLALENYQKAFDLGEQKPDLVQRLVLMLLARGQDVEAERILLEAERGKQTLPRELQRLATEVALRTGNGERAVALARKLVPEESKDPRQRLWLGQVLGEAGKAGEALREVRAALELNEKNPEAWVMLIAALVKDGKRDEAVATLATMRQQLPEGCRDLAMAEAYLALGDFEAAHQSFQTALEHLPNDPLVLRRAVAFYLRMDKPRQAEGLLLRLLSPSSGLEDLVPWARRQLALLLAAHLEENSYRQALALLERNRAEGENSLAQRRAVALVRGTHPELRTEALRDLEQTLAEAPLTQEEQFRLALLQEGAGNSAAARKLMLQLLTRDGNNPAYLVHHIQSLLMNNETEEASIWLDKLAQLEPGSKRVRQLRQRIMK